MNKIVQLSEWEYQELKKEAELSAATMEAEIKREMKDHCNLTVELKMDIGRDWEDVFHIKPIVNAKSGYYSAKGSFDDTAYALSYEEVSKVERKVIEWMEKQVRKRYKLDVDTVNKYNDRIRNQWKWNLFFLMLALAGWVVACFAIFS